MAGPILEFIIAGIFVIGSGVTLTRASDRIAEISGLGRLLAGSLLLAGATSLPEFFVDLSAIRKGMPDLAVGDLFGSSLMNLMILGCADLIHRNPRKMFSRAGAQHALSAAIAINVTTLAAISIFIGSPWADYAVGDIGIGPIAIGVVYVLGLRIVYRDQRISSQTDTELSRPNEGYSLMRALVIYGLSALVIFLASPFMAGNAGKIADMTGLGRTFIGSTLVAFSTSLPEVVSTVAAVRMGAFDLAVGNIFGSNTFNMFLFVPLDFFHSGSLMGAVSKNHVLTALGVIMTTSVAVMGQLYHEERRKTLIEPDAVAVIGLVLGSFFTLYWLG